MQPAPAVPGAKNHISVKGLVRTVALMNHFHSRWVEYIHALF